MAKYRVQLTVDKDWVDRFDLTFEAADEQEAEAQAMVEVKQNLRDYIRAHAEEKQFRIILMWKHPKYYKELERIRKQQEQADKRASEQARRVGGPTSREQGSEQASDQASEEDASKQR